LRGTAIARSHQEVCTVPPLLLACLAYIDVALPGSTLGLLWPSMRLSFGAPVGALGILLVPGIAASVLASALTGRLRPGTGTLAAAGTLLTAVALAAETLAPWLWVMAIGTVLFGLGFGVLDASLNAHAARHFGARDINWMHASYGLGATIGPVLVTALLSAGRGWREPAAQAGRGDEADLGGQRHQVRVRRVHGHELGERPRPGEARLGLPRAHLGVARPAVLARAAAAGERHRDPVPGPPLRHLGPGRHHSPGELVPAAAGSAGSAAEPPAASRTAARSRTWSRPGRPRPAREPATCTSPRPALLPRARI
jgi:hypothetical protein